MFILLISREKGKVEEMSHLYVREQDQAWGVRGWLPRLASPAGRKQLEENEGLEHTKPLAPSFLFLLTAHDSEAPGVVVWRAWTPGLRSHGIQASAA